MRSFLASALLFLSCILGGPAAADEVSARPDVVPPPDAPPRPEVLPRPDALQPQIRFWTRIYSGVDTSQGLIHDARHLDVVYQQIDLLDGFSQSEQQAQIDAVKARYRGILLRLAERPSDDDLTDEERRVLRLWPKGVSPETLREAAEEVRFQLGQADRFREGVIRSGAWYDHVLRQMRANGVPEELAYLPHVESSYNPAAYSHAGAAGLWQFMPATGRRFMRVDDVVDERFDPYASSEAAAEYLAENYRRTGSWPLAITGYNHGAGGMARAADELGTTDIAVIVRQWDGKGFGFASRNFYTEFLAAHDVAANAERYFGPLERDTPLALRTVTLDRHFSVGTLQRALGIDLDALRTANLALRQPFWRGTRYAPAGYTLRIPSRHPTAEEAAQILARTDEPAPPKVASTKSRRSRATASRAAGASPTKLASAKTAKPKPAVRWIEVGRGDTIAALAKRHGVSPQALMAANGLRDARKLKPGQRLKLPPKPDPLAAVGSFPHRS